MVAPPLVSGRECVTALGRLGYRLVRQRGTHARLECTGRAPLTVPMHDPLDRGTLRSILRTAGVSVEDFVALLDG